MAVWALAKGQLLLALWWWETQSVIGPNLLYWLFSRYSVRILVRQDQRSSIHLLWWLGRLFVLVSSWVHSLGTVKRICRSASIG